MISARIEAIREILETNEAAIITSHINRRYFTGFNSSAGTVIITKETAALLIDFRYYEKARETVNDLKVILCDRLYFQICEMLKKESIKTLLIETDNTTLSAFERLKQALSDFSISSEGILSERIEALRQIKSITEIENIKKAQSITDKAFGHILNFIEAGKSEIEIALELEFFMRKNGSEGVAFDTIAVSGKNSSLPHGVPTDKPLRIGDFLTMDFGAVYNGYCSDMTRTVAIGGLSDEQLTVYNTVLEAQKTALDIIAPEKVCRDIDKSARDLIYNRGFEGCFGHGLGHSVGLEIHENPACNTRDDTLLKPGMIMTVEPGIYLENKFGVRIEDMVLITDTGYENLTKSPKDLIIL